MSSIPTAVIAALTLVVGFAVADLTGVRALGGVVLVAGVAWCVVIAALVLGVATFALVDRPAQPARVA